MDIPLTCPCLKAPLLFAHILVELKHISNLAHLSLHPNKSNTRFSLNSHEYQNNIKPCIIIKPFRRLLMGGKREARSMRLTTVVYDEADIRKKSYSEI